MMDRLRPIKTRPQYVEYLQELTKLCSNVSLKDSDLEHIEHLAILLEAYEQQNSVVAATDPITAIRLRMHEYGLSPVDVVPHFGSRSRVSEVLNGKRALTIEMIRKLSAALDIPVEFLIETDAKESHGKTKQTDWSCFPVAEMYGRGWIEAKTKRSANLENAMTKFFDATADELFAVAYKKGISVRSGDLLSENARVAWLTRVISVVKTSKKSFPKFDRKNIDENLFEELARLSQLSDGPVEAVSKLSSIGIAVVYEPSLKNALIDGAATQYRETPIIAFTLRHDRIDNFWFTLLHELVHVSRHLEFDKYFIDDFDHEDKNSKMEAEANRIARDTLIPRTEWRRCAASKTPTIDNILSLARELRRDPAIVAGRIRRDKNDYSLFPELMGFGVLREKFIKGVQ